MDIWNYPMYSARMTSRLVGVSRDRVRRWVKGYDFSYQTTDRLHTVSKNPVIQREAKGDSPFSTFIEMVDLLFVRQFLDHGVSLQKIRNALIEAQELIGHKHFAYETFFTDGKNIFLQVKNKDNASAIMELLSEGQWVIASIIQELSSRLDFNEINQLANRWYPNGRDGLIVVDPRISFGKPTVLHRGIATSNIYDLYLGENESIDAVCHWMEIDRKEAEAAISFERNLLAA